MAALAGERANSALAATRPRLGRDAAAAGETASTVRWLRRASFCGVCASCIMRSTPLKLPALIGTQEIQRIAVVPVLHAPIDVTLRTGT
jgi:hypothetical protein